MLNVLIIDDDFKTSKDLEKLCIHYFNKRNSEGTTSDSEEGKSYSWETSYLDEYLELFNEHTKPKIRAGMGVMRFI